MEITEKNFAGSDTPQIFRSRLLVPGGLNLRFALACLVFLSGLLASCDFKSQATSGDAAVFYTCPMHPSVVSNTPGSCPVCNMSLIRVENKSDAPSGKRGNFIRIDRRRQELAGIRTDTVRVRNIRSASAIVGTVATDEDMLKTISFRNSGRIEKLFVKSAGTYIRAGSALYSLYSEQLFADEKTHLILLEKSRTSGHTSAMTGSLLEASRNKLRLRGLTGRQIEELEKSGRPGPLLTFYSELEGYVSEVNATEGMYVNEGSALLKLTSLRQVWVEARVYPNESAGIGESETFQVYYEGKPEQLYTGKRVYYNPYLEEGQRVQILRISINHTDGKLIPGTLVTVVPEISTGKVTAVPKSAVLLEKMKTVWVLSGNNTFEQRMVETGAENAEWIEITSGLKPGEIVVTEGAYLISSEFILKHGAEQGHVH